MARPSNTGARRAEIVDALLRVLAERGWAAATTAEIARAAGMTPGLLHYHFASKQEILLALVERLTATLQDRFERRAERAGDDPRARLFALLDAHVALDDDADPAAVASWAAIAAEAGHQPEVREVYARAIAKQLDAIDDLVSATLRAEGREVRGARRIAAGLLAAIEGAYRIAASAPGVLPEGFAAPTITRIAEGLLASQPRARR
ncbi:TetR/AcrR family transcriptional regulator [Sandaracinus amylolyticus]|uniref:TetR/AcrR family transcriptional regulator n=1 Tax=Sandaracinus amylolyticus TaxID=927083 RepID=UPI001F01AC94|nr:TetR/AcrR family transcriptional regulator [Sandaracinus amylolyticus]UJR80135.1 HTH-type transcriptional regulator BetI [Sandaracinus amylolyticus]